MNERKKIYVAIGIDVEEEGLFTGRYECLAPATSNVEALSELEPFLQRSIKPTLFCAYSVLASPQGASVLSSLASRVEIGAHLHHWNTPPLAQNLPENGVLEAVPAWDVSLSLLRSKLHALFSLCQQISGAPVRSFRMGRWDLHGAFFSLLAECGIKCDASVRPLHRGKDKNHGPNHFCAYPDPYWIALQAGRILEVPLTSFPLVRLPASALNFLAMSPHLGASFHKWGALTLLPVYHPFWYLRYIVKTHMARGGRVISLAWHSSEMQPGATPHMGSRRKVDAFLEKMHGFFDWLEKKYEVHYLPIGELCELKGFPEAAPQPGADWVGCDDGYDV